MARVGDVWPAHNRFYCGLRLLGGPDRGTLVATHTMLLIPGILFFVFPASDLADRTDPVALVLPLVVFLITYAALLRTSLMDPGIVPRYTGPDPEYCFDPRDPHKPRIRDIAIPRSGRRDDSDEIIVSQKWCDTCRLYRPPRATHCSICDNCVYKMDHHCPWVGNCVGERNYKWFFLFVSGVTTMCLLVFAISIADLAKISADPNEDGTGKKEFGNAVKEMPLAMVLAVFTFLMFWSIAGLSGYHLYLVVTNQTTNEQIKASYSSGPDKRPYSVGCARNISQVLCVPAPPSHFNFRAPADTLGEVFSRKRAPSRITYRVVSAGRPLTDTEAEIAMLSYDPPRGMGVDPADVEFDTPEVSDLSSSSSLTESANASKSTQSGPSVSSSSSSSSVPIKLMSPGAGKGPSRPAPPNRRNRSRRPPRLRQPSPRGTAAGSPPSPEEEERRGLTSPTPVVEE